TNPQDHYKAVKTLTASTMLFLLRCSQSSELAADFFGFILGFRPNGYMEESKRKKIENVQASKRRISSEPFSAHGATNKHNRSGLFSTFGYQAEYAPSRCSPDLSSPFLFNSHIL